MGPIAYIKKNRIKLLKILITVIVLYYLICICFQIFSVLFDDVYNTITLTYFILIIICNLLSEFSPYILHNYLLFVFPFLSHYSGRGAIYILIGVASVSPELNIYLNYGGYLLMIIGILCLYINWLILKNLKIEYQDFEVMKDNYQDFIEENQRESLVFPKLKNDYNNNSDKIMKDNDSDSDNDNNNEKEETKKEGNYQSIEMSEVKK